MATKPYKVFFCKLYGNLANEVCPKINNDDWDELEDCCSSCYGRGVFEAEVIPFKVKCIQDTELGESKKDEIVDAYIWGDKHFVVNGYITHISEFKKCFEIL